MTEWMIKCKCARLRRPIHDDKYDRMYCKRCYEWTEPRCNCDPNGEEIRDINGNIKPGRRYVCPYVTVTHPDNARHNT